MYFDIAPKQRREDFFNYEEEYNLVKKGLGSGERIIAVLGVRRVGKTSLLNVLFNELKGRKVWIDGRVLQNPRQELPAAIAEAVRSKQDLVFGSISSVVVQLPGLNVEIKRNELPTDALLQTKKVYVFVDEAQRAEPKGLADVLSYIYDRYPNIQMILSGSEVGLLEKVISNENPNGPLYGRHILKINMQRLRRSQSLEFLQRGFAQLKKGVKGSELKEAVEKLDGLMGWLTYYGYERAVRDNPHALIETIRKAVPLVAKEIESFLKTVQRRELYRTILETADGKMWSEIFIDAQKKVGPIDKGTFSRAIKRLLDYGFLEKHDEEYFLADPLIPRALAALRR